MENEEKNQDSQKEFPAQYQKLPDKELLKEALKNAELLLAHAGEHGLDVNKNDVEVIVESKYLDSNDAWTPKKEIEFWMAYRTISKAIQPVTIDSLHASKDKTIARPTWIAKIFGKRKNHSLARRAVVTYTIFTLLAMSILLVIQIYSVIGTTLVNTIETSNNRMQEIALRLGELTLIPEENPNKTLEQGQLSREATELTKKVDSSIKLLAEWLIYGKVLSLKTERYEDAARKVVDDEEQDANEKINTNIMVIQEARNLVFILGLYILPLLYGLLGGFAFVLRSLTNETKNMTYSKESNIKYSLRVLLGALGGLAIGLFWGDIETQKMGFIETLSPLVLAFITGYSVEFLFTAIDKIIETISKTQTQSIESNSK